MVWENRYEDKEKHPVRQERMKGMIGKKMREKSQYAICDKVQQRKKNAEISKKIHIKRYANRKLYRADTCKYVDINHIINLILEGYTVSIHCYVSQADITGEIIYRGIMLKERDIGQLISPGELHKIVKEGDGSLWEFMRRKGIVSPLNRTVKPAPRKISSARQTGFGIYKEEDPSIKRPASVQSPKPKIKIKEKLSLPKGNGQGF